MIIFDLDGTLADCEHRRHFVQRDHPINENRRLSEISLIRTPEPDPDPYIWRSNWTAFYEACDLDKPIGSTIDILNLLEPHFNIQIWSGRCESVRQKTEKWLNQYISVPLLYHPGECQAIKMRPMGDNLPDYMIKEIWLNQQCPDQFYFQQEKQKFPNGHSIDFVFASDPKEIEMWRRRGIFVFDVSQGKGGC